MKKLFYSLIAFTAALQVNAQSTFNTIGYVDINNIKAAALLHGDLWYDPAQIAKSECEFPKSSGKHIMYASGLWMAGYDVQSQLYVSAQTYRQTGNDYWPGPLDNNSTLNYATSSDWARIWKVNKTTIDSFKAANPHTLANTPAVILEWPAKNNPYAKGANNAALTITTDMAPFVDVNGDGQYNALDGDYPKIKGDQMLWWVFSDNGPTHNHSTNGGKALKAEVHASAYAYKRNTLIDNVIYYEFDIVNKSANNYTGFRCGIGADVSIGYDGDDFIGFDSSHRMGYVYNAQGVDVAPAPNSNCYGSQIPMAGIILLRIPGDTPPAYQPAGSFMYYSGFPGATGSPTVDSDFNNYLRARWRDNTHLKNDFTSPGIYSAGYGTGPDVNYVYPGNPAKAAEWSECASNNPSHDSRFVLAVNDHDLNAGSHALLAFALVTTNPGNNHACPNASLADLWQVADTAWGNFGFPLAVEDAARAKPAFRIYPNPASDRLFIEIENSSKGEVSIYNAMGRMVATGPLPLTARRELDISYLPAGIYYVRYSDGNIQQASSFIKE